MATPPPANSVLLCDANPIQARQVSQLVTHLKLHTQSVDGLDQVAHLATTHHYDLLLISAGWGTSPILRCLATLHEQQRETAVIVYGEPPASADVIQIMRSGVIDFVVSPWTPDQLLSSVRQGLQARQSVRAIVQLNEELEQTRKVLSAQKAALEQDKHALRARVHELSTIYDISRLLQPTMPVATLTAQLLEIVLHATHANACGILLWTGPEASPSLAVKALQGQTVSITPEMPPPIQLAMKWQTDQIPAVDSPLQAWLDRQFPTTAGHQAYRLYSLEAGLEPLGKLILVEQATQHVDSRFMSILVRQASGAIERAQSYHALAAERDRLERWNRDLQALHHLGAAMVGTLTPDTIVRHIINKLQTLIPYDYLGLSWFKESRTWGHSPQLLTDQETTRYQAQLTAYHSRLAQLPAVLPHPIEIEAPDEPGLTLLLPLTVAHNRIGLLYLSRTGGRTPFSDYEEGLIKTLANSLALSLRASEIHLDLQNMAETDPLTELMNRRAFTQHLEVECKKVRRHQEPLSLIMLDIDHFKAINDHHGHLAGDQMLQQLARLLRTTCREVDHLARYGGEEFVIVLPGADLAHADKVAARILDQVRIHPFGDEHRPLSLTVSLGVAQLEDLEAPSPTALIEAADRALYQAKASGRNQAKAATAPAHNLGRQATPSHDTALVPSRPTSETCHPMPTPTR